MPPSITVRLEIVGIVQGVGFRPTVARLAEAMGVRGWVCNEQCKVTIEAHGPLETLKRFEQALLRDSPPAARIDRIDWSEPLSSSSVSEGFRIIPSVVEPRGHLETGMVNISPDLATCQECLQELFSPNNRRYLYPFINCTACGPRLSIIESLPYDRERTSMKAFMMCQDCRSEFEDSGNRRFHAQPNACWKCGPMVEYLDEGGRRVVQEQAAITAAVQLLQSGKILALKGIGGFQLLVDATNPEAIGRLRCRKSRAAKPFAVMMPDVRFAGNFCQIDRDEEACLTSPAAPIVLLKQKHPFVLSALIAPSNFRLGVMLPYSPIHHLLLREMGKPVIATSGNRAHEPICYTSEQAIQRLGDIADGFLTHNRPIARPLDDSVAQIVMGKEQMLRCSRGYSPLVFPLKQATEAVLAVGAHEKSTFAFLCEKKAVLCQHVGDLDSAGAVEQLSRSITDMQTLFRITPQCVVGDQHPDYGSRIVAQALAIPEYLAYHHVAHAASCMIEHGLEPPLSAVVWDGTGLGNDGALWGGEFFRFDGRSWRRQGHLEPFRLIGGAKAIQEPWRVALSLLFQFFDHDFFSRWSEIPEQCFPGLRSYVKRHGKLLYSLWEKRVHSPSTTSMGRLFDGVASLCEICHEAGFEAQGPMMLEGLLNSETETKGYPFRVAENGEGAFEVVLKDLIAEILHDMIHQVSPEKIAARFHHGLVDLIIFAAGRMEEKRIILSGGCFQNAFLTQKAVQGLKENGFEPYWHQKVPANDAGIALGQLGAFIHGGGIQ